MSGSKAADGVARTGRILVIGGGLLAGIGVLVGASGQAVGLGAAGPGGLLVIGALGLLGVGCAVLSLAAPSPVRDRAVRSSLAIVAAGALAITASAIASASSEYDSLESLPIVLLTLGGGLALLVGLAALAISLPVALARRR
jgi:hypothetical protein